MRFCTLATLLTALIAASVSQALLAQDLATTKDTTASDAAVAERFDLEVREHFFAGFNGNEAELEIGMKKCQDVLLKNGKNAEAMVWLGGGEVYLSGQKFQKGNIPEGLKLWQAGFNRMNKAAELEPENIGVLIPRAAVLMPASRGLPSPMKEQVLKSVLKDFQHVYDIQKEYLDQIGEHPLGELRMGLADIYRSLNESEKSIEQLNAVVKELPGTDYAKRAEEWLAAKPTARLGHNCIGCHTK